MHCATIGYQELQLWMSTWRPLYLVVLGLYLVDYTQMSTGPWYAPGYLRQLHKPQKHNVRPAGDQVMHNTWECLKWQKQVNKKLNQILNLKLNSTLKVKNGYVYGHIFIVKQLGFQFAPSAWTPNCLNYIHISLHPGVLHPALVARVVK